MIPQENVQPEKIRLVPEEISRVLGTALERKDLIGEEDTSVIFYDFSFMLGRIMELTALFPDDALHAVAIKANPLIKVLRKIGDLGAGLEAASRPEVSLAQKAGIPCHRIVYDSPSKTRPEIEYALRQGVRLNADNFTELDRIADILQTVESSSEIGIRINPQVGTGSIAYTSVAGTISKFGIPMDANISKLKEYCLKYPWISGFHVHVGSQGCPVPQMIKGIAKVLDFAVEINRCFAGKGLDRRLIFIDIGGGLPVAFRPGDRPVMMPEYRKMLEESCPALFSGGFRIITEFGRHIHANAGWAATKVEYVKQEKDCNILMTHLGADFLLRRCYLPGDWHHEIFLADRFGRLKEGKELRKYMVAGPLCFAGDVIAKEILLPEAEEGDYLLIQDTGAYTLSMWSRYNSRQIPKVLGYHLGERDFEVLRERETPDQLTDFWQ